MPTTDPTPSTPRGVLRALGVRRGMPGDRVLLAVASRLEADAIATGLGADAVAALAAHARTGESEIEDWHAIRSGDHVDLLITGVGKANAAAGVAWVLNPGMTALGDHATHGAYRAVVSLGIAGALPAQSGPAAVGVAANVLDVVVGTSLVHADEGIETPTGFTSLRGMGFPACRGDGGLDGDLAQASSTPAPPPALPPPGLSVPTPVIDAWCAALSQYGWTDATNNPQPAVANRVVRVGRIATVSTCAGTDGRAATVARRTGAIAEAMEGAAVAQVASRLGVTFSEVRVISNTTGDRGHQRWDMRGALEALSRVAVAMVAD